MFIRNSLLQIANIQWKTQAVPKYAHYTRIEANGLKSHIVCMEYIKSGQAFLLMCDCQECPKCGHTDVCDLLFTRPIIRRTS